jgi:hypothetical protein
VKGAPRYDTPIYVVYREGEQGPALRIALDGLREVAGQKTSPSEPADRPGRTRPG